MFAFPEKNPYRPGVGTRPLHLAGREKEMRRFRATLRGAPEIPANTRLTGLRGVGKTVLLTEYKGIAEDEGWVTGLLELEPRHNTETALVTLMQAECERLRLLLSKLKRLQRRMGRAARSVGKLGVTYGDVTLTLEPGEAPQADELSRPLFQIAESAVGQGRAGVALLLDEAQALRDERTRGGEHPLSLLIAAVSGLQKAEVPIALVMCGLPTLIGNLLSARTYSERMFRGEEIGSLDLEEARSAFVEPLRDTSVTADDELVDQVLNTVEGYPYFIQLWGAELWDAAETISVPRFSTDLLADVEPEIYRRVDVDFYEPRIRTLTPAEQDLLLAAGKCPYPPLKVAQLYGATEKRPGNVNVLLGRLVEAGVIYRMRKGQYGYTAPKFHDFLKRRVERLE